MSVQREHILSSAEYIKEHLPSVPETMVVLGSGLGNYALDKEIASIDYKDIPHFPVSTVSGHAGRLCLCDINGSKVAVMRGRFHTYEGYTPDQAAYAVCVMAQAGIKNLILTNAAGGINESYAPGDLVLIKDHINLFNVTPLKGPNDDEAGPRFPDMCDAYNADLRQKIKARAAARGMKLKEGVYIFFPGPQFETPAEIRAARILGADLVGMSTVPETIAAVHRGLRVAAVSCVTNMAAGIAKSLSHMDVTETGQKTAPVFAALVEDIIALCAES